MATFPQASTAEAFYELSRGHPRIVAAAESLCLELGLGSAAMFAAGSLPVFAAGDAHVLKLYPPCFAHECHHERAVLSRLEGALPVATPRVVACGEVDGWCYLVMDRLPGTPLDAIWASLSLGDRVRLAGDLGRFLKALHGLDAGEVPRSSGDWADFVRGQEEGCAVAQQRQGLASRWVEQIPAFLARTELAPGDRQVLLHTEIMRAHVLAVEGAAGWSLSGVMDFEPAMVGAAEYEFAAVGLFLTCGSGPALRALLLSYGYRDGELEGPLQRRFLAYALLHRYSNLRRYLELLPPPESVTTLEALAARWWAVGDEPEVASARDATSQ